jgi:hypothetical protein
MSSSHSSTTTFTLTHAKYLSSKVATDLHRFQRFYGSPSTVRIADFEAELSELLKYDAVESVVYGFQRHEAWTAATIKYVRGPGGMIAVDDDPGKIRPNLDVSGAAFTSFLTYSAAWFRLSGAERAAIESRLVIQRSGSAEPQLEAGHWVSDRTYGSGGVALSRSSVGGV